MTREACSEGGRHRRRFARPGPLTLLLVPLLALVLSGCSAVRLAYDNADRLVLWEARDYVDLERDQRRWLRARIRVLLHWHRTSQLPEWSRTLREFDLMVQDGIEPAQLDRFYARGMNWGDELLLELLPTATELMASFSAAQVDGLPDAFAENNAALNEDYEGLEPDAQRAVWRDKVRDALTDWIGALTAEQEQLLSAASEHVEPDNRAWINYRERWQARLLQLLEQRTEPELFAAGFRELAVERERWFTPEYAVIRARNERAMREFAGALLGDLTERQSAKLSGRLTALADDFDALVASAGSAPADPGPAPGSAPGARARASTDATRTKP